MNIVELLKNKKLTISSAESFTGGLFANTITNIPGSSSVFIGSIISYNTKVKINNLNVNKKDVETYGVVSKEICYQMAQNVRQILGSDIGISFTGNAGPTSQENKPVGLIYIGLSFDDKTEVYEYHLQGNRLEIKNKAVLLALELISKLI